MMKLTQERLKELLHYDPETGVFTRLKTISNFKAKKGDIAGGINSIGYRQICVDGKHYNASRLAFLYTEGYFPEHEVDHKNRIKSDDRWDNLRHISKQCNARNSKIADDNTSGITGVSWDNINQRWRAYITTMPKKRIHLGRFGSKFNAARAKWNAEVKHGFPGCNTTSSAYLFLKAG